MISRWAIIAVCVFVPANVYALVYGGTNLGFGGYPSNDCSKPSKPFRPYSFDSQAEVDSFNLEVDNYNFELRQYLSCVQDYLDNANNDLQRIKDKAREAIAEANS